MSATERRAQIVDVARRCFAESGYANTTTARIALMAEVSEPVLYKHFTSKLDLFHEILAETLSESRRFFAKARDQHRSGAEKILALAVDFPCHCERNRHRFRVIERALASVEDDKTRSLLEGYYGELVRSLAEFVQEGRADGSIAIDVRPESLAWMFVMNGIGYCLLSCLDIPALSAAPFPEDLRRIVAGMIGHSSS